MFNPKLAAPFGKEIIKLKDGLEKFGYLAPLDMVFELIVWMEMRDGPFTLQGKPGTGKTSLVRAFCSYLGIEEPHRVDCYPDSDRSQTMYEWNRFLQKITSARIERESRKSGVVLNSAEYEAAIYNLEHLFVRPLLATVLDPSDTPVCLLNELDKVPLKSPLQSLILTFLDEFAITIEEMRTTVRRGSKRPPLIFITSNAGDKESRLSGGEEELPQTILRRSSVVYKIEEHSLAKQLEIIVKLCPNLNKRVAIDCVYYIKANEFQNLEKAISLSEIIKWAKKLEYLGITELTEEVVVGTVRKLGRTEFDVATLVSNCPSVFAQSIPLMKKQRDIVEELREEKAEEKRLLNELYDGRQLTESAVV